MVYSPIKEVVIWYTMVFAISKTKCTLLILGKYLLALWKILNPNLKMED